MNRRKFIAMGTGGVALVGVGAAGGVWLLCPDPADLFSTADMHVDEIARSMSGVAGAGRAWLEANPNASAGKLVLDALDLDAGQEISRGGVTESLAERVESEFANDHIFIHEDWWLAETEARLAALHVTLLGADASESSAPRFEDAPEAELVSLQRYNPGSVEQGEPLSHPGLPENVIWFATAAAPPPRFRVHIDGTSLTINARSSGFSVQVPDALRYRLFESPGSHEIWLYDPVVDRRQRLGELRVVEAASERDGFCEVAAWGPQQTQAGATFNEQPDGASAFWIRIECFPESTVVTLDGTEIDTTLRPADGLITTHILDHSLYREPGQYPVALKDARTGESIEVGKFVVTP
ncbi:MAG: hypothetical protein KGY48_10725 [Wenzhouxiangellaceae bacterium]|nr:hypothetical protein [Wenzhouxiangellaceae bacterium]MBS3824771.1 hypothetical protein [Wenzhouxiangellaceae bacterium]